MPIEPAYKPAPYHLELGDGFYDPVAPASFPLALLRFRNQEWAKRMGLGALTPEEWERSFARFAPLPGNLPQPLALRYHGDQFRRYNPDLGDGRGFLYAQVVDPADGRLLDLGTKGSGQTPWSRAGDGRLTLKGAVREALATEMLEALGVYTSKTFSIFETGESLWRGDEPSPTRSAVLVRLSHGHIRFGTFQRYAFSGDSERLLRLLRYTVARYFPALDARAAASELGPGFLREVARRSGQLAASWMVAGFVHGVLNTDNMNVTGESFDYGPYRFLPRYDSGFIAAYFDHGGLYAYGRQPESVFWNLRRLAQSLVPLAPKGADGEPDAQPLADALDAFAAGFNRALAERMCERLGLVARPLPEGEALCQAAFRFLEESGIGFDQFFFDAYGGLARAEERAVASPQAESYRASAWAAFAQSLAKFEPTASARAATGSGGDPYFAAQEPCSLLIDEIELIWEAIAARDDWAPFAGKIAAIRRMRRAYGRGAECLGI